MRMLPCRQLWIRPVRHLLVKLLSISCTCWSFLWDCQSEINLPRFTFIPKYSYYQKKLNQCYWTEILVWAECIIQSKIDPIPVSTDVKRASIILVGWSGIESPTTLFYCYHETTWFVCFVQFIFHQILILIALESIRLTHLKFARIRIKGRFWSRI